MDGLDRLRATLVCMREQLKGKKGDSSEGRAKRAAGQENEPAPSFLLGKPTFEVLIPDFVQFSGRYFPHDLFAFP